MAVGPRDIIDQLLVKKYASEKTNNNENLTMVDAQKMMDAMTDYANMHRNMLAMNAKLQSVCAQINTKSVKYRATRDFAGV